MPARKCVQSLKQLCLSYLSSNNEDDTFVFNIPNNILDDVVNCPQYSKLIRLQHVKSIIDRYVNRLNAAIHQLTHRIDFREKPHVVIQRGIELIRNVCTNLTHLNLTATRVKEDDLKNIAKSIPRIIFLHLRETQTSDHVLSILSDNCPKLLELDVSYCFITDNGIKALCEKNRGGCWLIRKLLVTNTAITDDGATSIISNLPYLRYFDYRNILSVLENVYDRSHSPKNLKLEMIRYGRHPNVSISGSTINAASFLCQNIKTVILSGLQRTDHWLPKLADFPRLENLSLTSSFVRVNFEEHIAPLLKITGNNLKSLVLSHIEGINLWYVGMFCGCLRNLTLIENNRYVSTLLINVNNSEQIFSELRSLHVECVGENYLPSYQLERVLSNCRNVENLYFRRCYSLTDELLTRVCRRNIFSNLSTFSVILCSNIQKTSLISIVNTCSSLKFLNYFKCARVRFADHRQLQQLVQNENLDLVLGY